MRTLFLWICTLGSAAAAASWAVGAGAALAPYAGVGPHPLALLFVLPAALVGAGVGACAAALVVPPRL